MPQAVAAVAAWAVSATVAVTGSVTLAAAVGNAILWVGTWKGIATIAAVAYSLTRKPPKLSDPGAQSKFTADPNSPRKFVVGRTAVGGNAVFATTYDKNQTLMYVVALSSGGPIQGLVEFRLDKTTQTIGPASTKVYIGEEGHVSSNKWRDRVWCVFRNGARPEGAYRGHGISSYVPEWTEAHRISGVAKAYFFLRYDKDVFTTGVPAPLFVLDGVKCYDMRKDGTYPGGSGAHRIDNPDTWEFTRNGGLIALWWALGCKENGKLIGGMGVPSLMLDIDSFKDVANVCDANGWTCNGEISAGDSKSAIMDAICASFGGEFTPRAGKLGVYAGAASSSVLTLTDDDLAASLGFNNSRPSRDRKNTVIVKYRNPADNYEMTPSAPVTDATYKSEDGGEEKVVTIEIPMIDNATQAAQVGALKLAEMREHYSINSVFKPVARIVKEGQCVTFNSNALALNAKYRVMKRRLMPDGSVGLTLRLETDAKYAWAMGQSQTEPTPPAFTRFDPSSVAAPNGWSAAGRYEIIGATPLIYLRVTGSNDEPFADSTLVEYRKSGQADWLQAGEYDNSIKQIDISGVEGKALYDVSIRYRLVGSSRLTERLIIPNVLAPVESAPAAPKGFWAYESGSSLRFVVIPVETPEPHDYEVRVGSTWEAGVTVCLFSGSTITVLDPVIGDGSNQYWCRTKTRRNGVYSTTGLFWDLDRAATPNRNETFSADFQALDWPGVLHDLTATGPSGSKALVLNSANGVRGPYGDYYAEIDLGYTPTQKFETKFTTLAGRDVAPSPTLDEAADVTLLGAAQTVLNSPAIPTSDVRLTNWIALDAPPTDCIAYARLNGSLAMTGGVLSGLASVAGYEDCLYADGARMSSSSFVGWSGTFGSVLTALFTLRPRALPSADCVLIELSTGDGGWLQLRYDHAGGLIKALDDAGAFVSADAPDWTIDDPVTFGLVQNGGERALAYWSRLSPAVTFASGDAPSIGTVDGISFAGAGGVSLDEAATLTLSAAASVTLLAAGGSGLVPDAVLGDVEVRSTAFTELDFEQAVRRGPAGFSPYQPFYGADYLYRRAAIWQRVAVETGYGDAVKIESAEILADVPDVVDSGTADILAAGTFVPFTRTFHVIPQNPVVTQISGASNAARINTVMAINGFTATAFNSAGVAIDAGISWAIRGR